MLLSRLTLHMIHDRLGSVQPFFFKFYQRSGKHWITCMHVHRSPKSSQWVLVVLKLGWNHVLSDDDSYTRSITKIYFFRTNLWKRKQKEEVMTALGRFTRMMVDIAQTWYILCSGSGNDAAGREFAFAMTEQ